MKSTKLVLIAVLLFGILPACKRPEPAAPAVEPGPAATEPAATPAPDPTDTQSPGDQAPDAETDEDLPHSGGDKVGTRPAQASETPPPEN
jgi:hypothetical protein